MFEVYLVCEGTMPGSQASATVMMDQSRKDSDLRRRALYHMVRKHLARLYERDDRQTVCERLLSLTRSRLGIRTYPARILLCGRLDMMRPDFDGLRDAARARN